MKIDGDSFAPAWAILTKRFDNKRLLISAHVSRLIGDRTIIKCNAQELNKLLGSLNESLNALKALDINVEQWDPILIHLITMRLDRPLIEAWENKLGSSSAMPSFEQLTSFLCDRARAQERLESTQTKSSATHPPRVLPMKSNQQPNRSHVAATARTANSNQYPCDMCGKDHYIVSCPDFVTLSPSMRVKQVVKHKLCYNCFGHHNVPQCNSKRVCKICDCQHHTMIHGPHEQLKQSTQIIPSTSSTH